MILALSLSGFSQDEALMQDANTKPALSLRCKELFRERGEKIKVQQRLNALIQRNRAASRKTPKMKETLHARLESNLLKIKNELTLINLQIESMEENIIRSGCPGLTDFTSLFFSC